MTVPTTPAAAPTAPAATSTSTEAQPQDATSTTTAAPAATVETPSEIEALKLQIAALEKSSSTWEARSKGNFDKVKKIDDFLASLSGDGAETKPDIETALADLQKKYAENELRATRADVITSKNVPAAAQSLLVGDTREALEASADAILSLLSTVGTTQTPAATNSADANGAQGTPVGTAVTQLTADEYKNLSSAEKLKARDEGRLKTLMGL